MPKTLYIVTGMHRSGTSLIARMLQVYGIALPGELAGPALDNEKGFFEDTAIVELNDQLLRAASLEWDSLHGFFLAPSAFSHPRFNHLKKQAEDLLVERVALDRDWAFKDPRVSRLMGFWLPLLKSADVPLKVVVAVRNPADVAGSLSRRNGFIDLKSQYLWLLHTLDALTSTAGYPQLVVQYENLLEHPMDTCGRGEAFFGPADTALLTEFTQHFLSKQLRHNQDFRPAVSVDLVDELYKALLDSADLLRSVDQIRCELQGRTDVMSVLSLVADTERTAAMEHQRFIDETTTLRRSADLLEQQRDQLQADVQGQRAWSDKLAADVESLNKKVDELDGELVASKQQKDAEIAALTVESEAESMRLWAIIEKYRLRVADFESSLSWKLTQPLRLVRRVAQQASFTLLRMIKAGAKRLLYVLPSDNMLRVRVIKLYERCHSLIRGDIDNHSIRASHASLIADRREFLGSKPILPPEDLPEIDISVVTYNSQAWIESFVASLERQHLPLRKINLIFVDNSSSDETVADLQGRDWSAFASFRLIQSENRGFGAGHNQAIAAGNSRFVLVTNIDLEFRADSLSAVLSFAVQDLEVVASWELRQAPYEHPKFYDPVTLRTGWSSHACVLLRRESLERVGGYEERIFMYGEDVEISYRLRAEGLMLRYVPMAVVDHYTYAEPGEVKLLQYQGSTLANAYIRLRYGSVVDVLRIPYLYSRLLSGRSGVPENSHVIRSNIREIVRNGIYFLRQRQRVGEFSFRNWDYEIDRAGAFYVGLHSAGTLPLVSVVTRTYRGRDDLLREALQSVAHQSYPMIEHVIVEDGGEALRGVTEDFCAAYPTAKVSYHPIEKSGRCKAGNIGLARANGKYVVFLDDDDLLFSDHIETCVAELEADTKLVAAYALAWEIETEFNETGYEEKSHGTPQMLCQPFDKQVLADHNYIPIQAIVFKRSLYEKLGGFDEDLENLEDWNLWVRYATAGDFKFIEKTTSMFRTPWDLEQKSRRQAILDGYLPVARSKNAVGIL